MQSVKPKRHFKKRWLFLLLLPLLIPVWILARPETYLPHERIVLTVPFDINNPPDGLIPMGETIHHPKPDTPNGHPGIDFGWGMGGGTANSASDGKVKSIVQGASEGELWDVTVSSGLYELRYKELKSYNQALRKGSVVKKGDLIGIPGTLANGYHWELASVSILRDRFCPMTYFDEQSRQLMNSIWDSVRTEGNEIKQQFPDICSGDYKNKVD